MDKKVNPVLLQVTTVAQAAEMYKCDVSYIRAIAPKLAAVGQADKKNGVWIIMVSALEELFKE